MQWNQTLTQLNSILAELYPDQQLIPRIIKIAGISGLQVNLVGRPVDVWFNVISEFQKHERIFDLVRTVRGEYPNNTQLQQIEQDLIHDSLPSYSNVPTIDSDTKWNIDNITAEELEKIIGNQSTMLPISFLEVGIKCALSVCRIKVNGGSGTGFLTNNNVIITNHHVIPTIEEANHAVAQFNYQKTATGLDSQISEYRLDPSNGKGFATSEEDDWSLIKINGDANAKWGAIEIKENLAIEKTDYVNIIQHPGGEHKQDVCQGAIGVIMAIPGHNDIAPPDTLFCSGRPASTPLIAFGSRNRSPQ